MLTLHKLDPQSAEIQKAYGLSGYLLGSFSVL